MSEQHEVPTWFKVTVLFLFIVAIVGSMSW